MSDHRTTIAVAIIGLISAISVAVVSNWDKFFPNNNNSVVVIPQKQVTEISNKPPLKIEGKWEVAEGSINYEWSGYWQVESDGSFFGKYKSAMLNSTIQISGTIDIANKNITVHRTFSSDGNTCTYHGTVIGMQVDGTYKCLNGGPFKWRAKLPGQ